MKKFLPNVNEEQMIDIEKDMKDIQFDEKFDKGQTFLRQIYDFFKKNYFTRKNFSYFSKKYLLLDTAENVIFYKKIEFLD